MSVFVMERDSVTFQTGVEITQQDRIRWYFNGVRIAQITEDLGFICTDVQCNEGNERFRDRLKLDNQTGSLTITSTRTTDSGLYELIISSKNNVEKDKTFKLALHGEFKSKSSYVTLEHKSSFKSLGYICSNSQKYIVWVKIINVSFMTKIMFHEDI